MLYLPGELNFGSNCELMYRDLFIEDFLYKFVHFGLIFLLKGFEAY
jgi:hypothetical protein